MFLCQNHLSCEFREFAAGPSGMMGFKIRSPDIEQDVPISNKESPY